MPQDALTYRYVVDDADSLTEIHLTDGGNPEILIESFSHDSDGNMTTRTNEVTDEVITYQWNDFDKLVKASSAISGVPTTTAKVDNRFDVNGIRKRKINKSGNASSEYTIDIATSTSKGTGTSTLPTISYIQGHQILGYEENGSFRFFLTDHLSSVRDIVDDTGTVIKSMEYSEYGNLLNSSGSGTNSPKTWVGGLSVNDDTADSGLYLMGHRHYSGVLGRFINRDPIGFAGGLSLYNYPTNPVNAVDPSGLNVAVIVSGPVETNPFGHVAIALEGHGVFSFGTNTPFGSSIIAYLETQLPRRDVQILSINTTELQEKAILDFLLKQKDDLDNTDPDTCATRVAMALDKADIDIDARLSNDLRPEFLGQVLHPGGLGVNPFLPKVQRAFPAQTAGIARAAIQKQGGNQISLSMGSPVFRFPNNGIRRYEPFFGPRCR